MMTRKQKTFPGQYSWEKILFSSRASVLWFLWDKKWNLFLFTFIVLLAVWVGFSISGDMGSVLTVLALVIFAIYVLYIWVKFHDTRIVITSRRVLVFERLGIFTRFTKETKLQSIKQVVCGRKWLIETMLWFGEVTVHAYDDKEHIYFKGLSKHDQVVAYLSRIIDYIHHNGATDELSSFKSRKERYSSRNK